MNKSELTEKISTYLRSHPNSNARQVAKYLGLDKTSVNSILYANKNVVFVLHETKPPTWSFIGHSQIEIPSRKTQFRVLRTSDPIHIDFQGGDWSVKIQVRDASRNDPIVSLERTGPNLALIQVSSSVISAEDSQGEHLPDVVLALASSALAWEIAVQSDAILEEKFNFANALRDIYLSVVVNDKTKFGE